MVLKPLHDRIGRRSRMHPQSTGKRIRLTERDLLWMQKINTHGPLSTNELVAFGKHLGNNIQRAKNRLTDLFNEDNNTHNQPYLTRPKQQFQTIDARYNELVYDLSPTGVQALKDADHFHQNSGTSPGPWWHERMVAKFTASAELKLWVIRRSITFLGGKYWNVQKQSCVFPPHSMIHIPENV